MFSTAQIFPADLYLHSDAITNLIQKIHDAGLSMEQCRSIYVEATKNRKADNQTGRYMDKELGLLGYDLLHLLTILSRLMTKEDWQTFLSLREKDLYLKVTPDHQDLDSGEVLLVWNQNPTMRVEVYTSTSGRINDSNAIDFQMPTQIPYGETQKYNAIILKFDDFEFKLRLEPIGQFDGHDIERQTHLLIIKSENNVEKIFFKDNAFENTLKYHISLIHKNETASDQTIKSLMKEHIQKLQFLGKMKLFENNSRENNNGKK